MQELEKILEEIESMEYPAEGIGCGLEDISITDRYESAEYGWNEAVERITEIIRKHMNDGWIPVEDRLPEEKRANYEVTFINECGYEEHGFARWYDGEFHVPAVVIAWRNHLEPYRPERSDNHDGE